MYCARCGDDVAARAVVCRTCGADLTRAGALRMTAGGLYEHAADLGLPASLVDRLDRDESARRQAAALAQAAARPADEDAALETRHIPRVPTTPTAPDEVVAHPAVNPQASSTRTTVIATVLVVLLVVAAMLLVNTLAQRLMDPLPPVGPPTTSTSQTPTPSASPT